MYALKAPLQHSSMERFGQARPPQHRYTPYPAPASAIVAPRKLSTSSRGSLSLDIPALSLHDAPRTTPSPVRRTVPIQLPPIQQPDTQPVYALPPISALEDLRGVDAQDSAAVLRRLQSDDDSFSESTQIREPQRPAQRSLSAPATKYVLHPRSPS